jgi:hypothetical protein
MNDRVTRLRVDQCARGMSCSQKIERRRAAKDSGHGSLDIVRLELLSGRLDCRLDLVDFFVA